MYTSVVILTKDRPDYLESVIKDIQQQSGIITNIFVVNNGIDDDTETICDVYGAHHIKTGPINSFAEGCNLGAKFAFSTNPATNVLTFVNNDVRMFHPSTLRRMHELTEVAGVAGTSAINSDETINHEGTSFDNAIPYHINRGKPLTYAVPPIYVPAVSFACVSVRSDVWKQIGGLDTSFTWGFEDTSFCLTARMLNYKVAVERRTPVIHNEFGTRTREDDQRNLGVYLSKWIYKFQRNEIPFDDVGEEIF